ncbi:MAG: RidA family protein [Cytophagales bacterium]|nr:RidA family protein [Cytophagales bacterium]MDW8385256.1 RidA family protein [Flammeovirgaceae bacterium]
MKQVIQTTEAPLPIGPYSQATMVGNMLFISGQIALNPQTGEMVQADIEEETHRVMQNIGAILQRAGMSYENIVKTTIFVKNLENFSRINQVYGSYFSSHFPARETVEVSRLPKDAQVEISCIAVR